MIKLMLKKEVSIQLVVSMLVSEDITFMFNAESNPVITMYPSSMNWLLTTLRSLKLDEEWFVEYDGSKFNEWGTKVKGDV